MTTSLKAIGRRVAQERKKRGLTQEDLAGLCEVDRSYLSEIENGYKNLSVLILLKLADALDMKASKLLGE